jgi:hypothetical protein
MLVNLIYPIVFKRFQKSKNYRLYANLFTIVVNRGFLGWYYLTGKDNPRATMAPNIAVRLAMANRHVSETQDHLEKMAGQGFLMIYRYKPPE